MNWIQAGWQSLKQVLGLSVALGVFWCLLRKEILPPWDAPFVIYGLPFAILVTAGLGLASLFEQLTKWVMAAWKKRCKAREQNQKNEEHKRQFVEHIPYMTKNELAIYGYLLTNSRKSFTAEIDGGHAASLYKRGFIQTDAQSGLSYGPFDFPFSVPDHIWSAMEENRDQFPSEFQDQQLPWFRRHF